MHKTDFKLLKVLALSVLSLVVYFYLENSVRVNKIILKIQNNRSSKGFEDYLAINLIKWFLLIFGVISLIMIIIQLAKKKDI